jgi:hypothetical protein
MGHYRLAPLNRGLIDGRPHGVGNDWNDVLRASMAEKYPGKNTSPEPGS